MPNPGRNWQNFLFNYKAVRMGGLKITAPKCCDTLNHNQPEMLQPCIHQQLQNYNGTSSAKSFKCILVNIIFVYYICIFLHNYLIIFEIIFFNLKNYFIHILIKYTYIFYFFKLLKGRPDNCCVTTNKFKHEFHSFSHIYIYI